MANRTDGWVRPGNDAVSKAVRQLVQLVDEQLPQRFYREHRWRPLGAALILRMVETVESIAALMQRGYAVDSDILVRALYEQVVNYCWLSIDRDANPDLWRNNAIHWRRKLHNDAKNYGLEVMSPEEHAEAKGARQLKIIEMADAVDKHWGARLVDFRSPSDPPDMLTFSGLYVALYRTTSRAAHAQPDSLDPYIRHDRRAVVVERPQNQETIWWPVTVPLFTQALIVCHVQLGWPDPDRARAANNEMYAIP